MFEITVILEFSAAHNLRNYHGRCERLHGHNWQVEAVFGAVLLTKGEMVMDFTLAKKMLKQVLRYFDHRYINDTVHFKKVNPTSEKIAKFIFQSLSGKLKKQKCKVLKVSVWETPRNRATYYE